MVDILSLMLYTKLVVIIDSILVYLGHLQVTLLDIGQLRVGKGYLMVTVGQQG